MTEVSKARKRSTLNPRRLNEAYRYRRIARKMQILFFGDCSLCNATAPGRGDPDDRPAKAWARKSLASQGMAQGV